MGLKCPMFQNLDNSAGKGQVPGHHAVQAIVRVELGGRRLAGKDEGGRT